MAQHSAPSADPTPQKRRTLVYVAVAALCLIAAGLLFLSLRGGGTSTTPTESASSAPASNTEAATETPSEATAEPEAPTDEGNPEAEGEAPVAPEGSHAGGPEERADATTLASWEDTARAFIAIYPVNHQLSTAGGEPTRMDLQTWAANCLQYVDPSSQLGQALQNDPASIATPLGFDEAAAYVESTDVMSSDIEGVVVQATIVGTQQDWQHTSSFASTYLVQFNDAGQVTGVVDYN